MGQNGIVINHEEQNENNLQENEVDSIEPFQVPENSDRIPLVTLDPLNLINDFENRILPARPYTAPPLSYKKEIKNFSMPIIPGQVPQ